MLLKALHICPGYFQSALYSRLLKALSSMGIQNEVFALDFESNLPHIKKTGNIKVLNGSFSLIDRLLFFGKQRKFYDAITKEFPVSEFDIIHSHTLFSSGFSAYLIKKASGVNYLVTVRNVDVRIFFRRMIHLRKLGRKIMENSGFVVFLSPVYRDHVINRYINEKNRKQILEKSVVIPNGIDDYFLRNRYISDRDKIGKHIRIIYVGAINANKNIKTTIKACRVLIERGYSVTYKIVGEILDNSYFRKVTRDCGFIKYHARCPKEQVLLHLRSADIFVMPSITESFGLAYAEAMSQGLPVIYTRGQGFDGQFEEGQAGYSVDCLNHIEIAEKILLLCNNYREFSVRCTNLVDKFNWQEIAVIYQNLYNNLRNNRISISG